MAEYVKLNAAGLERLREVNPRLVSYNVEMTEVTGGTFWKAYTEAQIDGTEQVPPPDFSKGLASMHQWYDPIDTTTPAWSSWRRRLEAAGCGSPVPGRPGLTTTLKMRIPQVPPRKATRMC